MLVLVVVVLLHVLSTDIILVRAAPENYGDFRNAKLVECYDGDTCKFDLPNIHPLLGSKINVRLLGIDAPEIKSKCKEERRLGFFARDSLRSLLFNASAIRLKSTRRDKYFRILADIYADEVDVQQVLLDRKLVIPYNGRNKYQQGWCQTAKDSHIEL